MAKIDFKKELKALYAPRKGRFEIVDVPPLRMLAIDGAGDPNTSEDYARAIAALYAISYGLKFRLKKADDPLDYSVMPLEALWWADDMDAFTARDKARWKWTAMIMQPDRVTQAMVDEVKEEKAAKKDLPALSSVRLATFEEGRAAQCLHIGPYDAEAPTIAALHRFIADEGYALGGRHHEIYLSDPRRSDPAKLRTILRQPVA